MSENKYIRDLPPWPLGTPLPDNGLFVFYAPDLDEEFTATPAQLGVAGPVEPPANTTPAAPTVNFNFTTRRLSATHALGTGALEYRHGGVVTAYAALSIDGNAHPAGEWEFRVKAASGRNVSDWADSPAIEVAIVAGNLSVSISAQRAATLTLPAGAVLSDYEYQLRPAPAVSGQRVADLTGTLAAGESYTEYEYQTR